MMKKVFTYRYPLSSELILKAAGDNYQKLLSRFLSVLNLESDEVRDF